MKKVCITYHMLNHEEEAETCITLPMADHLADELIEHYGELRLQPPNLQVYVILDSLSTIQGYTFAGIMQAEEDKRFAPVTCSQCGERFTWQDLRDFRHMGERYFRSGSEFMCPDCYADFTGMDLENQMDALLGKTKLEDLT